ncbi:MAG: (Fe-S)-binding protein [Candidatus Woesearchaeota archaeon]
MGITEIFKKISNVFIDKEVDQYFPGCLTEIKIPELKDNYLEICRILNIRLELFDLICCGLPAVNAGNDDFFLDEKRKSQILEENIVKIYSNCPSCVFHLKEKNYNVDHILELIYEKLKVHKKIRKLNMKVTFHDPCHLGRYLGKYDLPRDILRLIGCEVVEMKHNKENSMCCGAGGGLINNNPEVAKKIAKERMREAKDVANILVTACPLCYLHLKEVSDNVEVYEISTLILKALKEDKK